MMARFWPSKEAAEAMPEVARGMNRMRKTVFLAHTEVRRLGKLATGAGRPRHRNPPDEKRAGAEPADPRSGEIVAQLTQAGLIDAYQLVVVPIVLGSGRTLFDGVTGKPRFELTKTRAFENGNVVGWYERA
jgi:hypothetical protein